MDEDKQPDQTPTDNQPTDQPPTTPEPATDSSTDTTNFETNSSTAEPADETRVEQPPVVPHEDFADDAVGSRIAPVVEPEIEPTTTPDDNPAPTTASAAVDPKSEPATASSRVRLIILAVIAVLVLVGAGLVFWQMTKADDAGDPVPTNTTATVEKPKLGVSVTVVDGTVTYQSTGDEDWQPLTTDTSLSEGDVVRTDEASRAVLALDDGSALRLDADTMVELVSLAADDVRVEQLTGSVYSRVVPSERQYTVVVGEADYQALGTAFVTVNLPGTSGVQVFQSSVKASEVDGPVGEGQQYYVANSNAALTNQVTGIDLGQLVDNKFIAWNLAEDKKSDQYKDKLGVLSQIDKLAKEKAALAKAEAERKKAEEAARQAAEKARREAERKAREAAPAMTIKASDGGVLWSYNGEAKYGFKVLYSSTNAQPVFHQDGTDAVYVDEPRARFYHIQKKLDKGKTYYVRVCAYYPNEPTGPCLDYSNVITIKRTGS